MQTTYYPTHTRYRDRDNYLFFRIIPMKLSYSGSVSEHNIGTLPVTERIGETICFMAPMEFQATSSHTWEPLTTVVSRIKDIMAQSAQEAQLSTARHKVDTALLYQDSDRRQIELMINLGVYENPVRDVMEPVNKFRKWSAPERVGTGSLRTEVKNPYVFRIDTILGTGRVLPIVNIRAAVCVGVQPQFFGPYIKGYPSRCELALSFRDMEPLTQQSYLDQPDLTDRHFSRVTVGSPRATRG